MFSFYIGDPPWFRYDGWSGMLNTDQSRPEIQAAMPSVVNYLPEEYYTRFLSDVGKTLKPSPIEYADTLNQPIVQNVTTSLEPFSDGDASGDVVLACWKTERNYVSFNFRSLYGSVA
jgi:hypothetical protein